MNRMVLMSSAVQFQGVTDEQLSYLLCNFGIFGDGLTYHEAKDAADHILWQKFLNSVEWDNVRIS